MQIPVAHRGKRSPVLIIGAEGGRGAGLLFMEQSSFFRTSYLRGYNCLFSGRQAETHRAEVSETQWEASDEEAGRFLSKRIRGDGVGPVVSLTQSNAP